MAIKTAQTTIAGLLSQIIATQQAQGNILSMLVQQDGEILQQEDTILQKLANLQNTCDQILANVGIGGAAAGFRVDLQSENRTGASTMAKKATATVDFTLFDNGQAVGTASVVDAAGFPTTLPAGTSVPTWTPSDPSAIAVSPAADGMSAIVSPATPPKLATGVTITVSATESDGTTILTGVSDPIDVVAGPAAGFAIALSNK